MRLLLLFCTICVVTVFAEESTNGDVKSRVYKQQPGSSHKQKTTTKLQGNHTAGHAGNAKLAHQTYEVQQPEARSGQAGESQITKFDQLSSSGPATVKWGDCSLDKTQTQPGCEASYKTKLQCQMESLVPALFDQLFKDPKKSDADFIKYSRGLINPSNYAIAAGQSIVINSCNTQKKTVKFPLTATATDIQVNEWLKLTSVQLNFELNYNALSKAATDDWFVMNLKGSGTMNGNPADIVKESGADGQDQDPVITLRYQKEVAIPDFMALIKQPMEQLYTERTKETGFDHTVMGLKDTTVAVNGESGAFKIILTGKNIWNAYITGKPQSTNGKTFFQAATSFYVYCKNGEPDDFKIATCAVMCKFPKGGFKWEQTTQVTNGDPQNLGVEKGLFAEVLKAEQLVFRSSRLGLQSPDSTEVTKDLGSFVQIEAPTADDPNQIFLDHYSGREMCVVAQVKTKGSYQKAIDIDTLLVHACPSPKSVRIHIPFRYPETENEAAVLKYGSLPLLSIGEDQPNSDFKIKPQQNVYCDTFEVKRGDNDHLQFCHHYNFYKEYVILPKAPKSGQVKMSNTTFIECKQYGKEWDLSGSGTEYIYTGAADVEAFTLNRKRHGIKGALNIFYSDVISVRAGLNYLPDDDLHQRVFRRLAKFQIKDLQFNAFFEKKHAVFFSGTAVFNSDFEFELIYYTKKNGKAYQSLCMQGADDSMGKMLGFLYFDTPVMRQSAWKVYQTFGIVSRGEDKASRWQNKGCRKMDEEILAANPNHPKHGVKVHASNVDLTKCTSDQKVCHFLHRCFGDTLNIVYTGVLLPQDFYFLTGDSGDQKMNLGPGLVFVPKQHNTMVKKAKDPAGKDIVDMKDFMTGTLSIAHSALTFETKIAFIGQKVVVSIPKNKDDTIPSVSAEFLGIENVQASAEVFSQPYAIDLVNPLERVEFHSPLSIGTVPSGYIKLKGGQDRTRQYVYGADKTKNRFYACVDSRKMKVKRLFKAFGGKAPKNIFGQWYLSETSCFTYHSDETPWTIAEKDLEVESGLWLTGEIYEDENSRRLRFEALFENGAVEMTVYLPKVEWGKSTTDITQVDEVEVEGKTETKTNTVKKDIVRTEMTMSEDTDGDDMGPKYKIKYSGQNFVEGSIKGFIRTIGFQGDGQVDIRMDDTSNRRNSALYTYSIDTSADAVKGKIFKNYDGTLTLIARSQESDLEKLDFEVEIDILNDLRKKLTDEIVQQAVTEFSSTYTTVYDSLSATLTKYEAKEKEFNKFATEFSSGAAEQKATVQRSKIERARAVQAANKRCSHECKGVHMPGLNWDGNCMSTSSGHVAGCMKFFPDKAIVSDVGCLSKCESERVRSHVEAITQDAKTRSDIEEYRYKAECESLSSELKTDFITSELSNLRSLQTLINGEDGNFMRDLISTAKTNPKFIKLVKFTSKLKMTDIKQPSCVDFIIGFSINSGKTPLDDYKDEICFNGKLENILIKDALERAFVDANKKLQEHLDNVESSISKLEFEYQDKIEKGKRYAAVKACLKKEAFALAAEELTTVTRSYIPGMDLSTFHPSNFHVFSDETTLLFNKYSPWNELERNNPFSEVQNHAVRSTEPKPSAGDSACKATKRTVEDFQEVIGYMNKWAHAHQNGQDTLAKVKSSIAKQLDQTAKEIKGFTSHLLDDMDHLQMYHWFNVTQTGMKRWLDLSTKHMDRLNKEGFQLIKDQVKSIYNDQGHKDFKSYFTKLADDGNKAFKKANIETPEGDFSVLSKGLLHFWEGNFTLEEMKPLLEVFQRKVERAEKRAITCIA